MGFAHKAFVAAGAGFAASVLVGCGSSGGSLLSSAQANNLTAQLTRVSQALNAQNCSQAQQYLQDFQTSIENMGGVNSTLISNLDQGVSTVESLANQECRTTVTAPKKTPTRTQTTTTATQTTPTFTNPSTDTYTQPTYTQPSDTTTTTATTPTANTNTTGGGCLTCVTSVTTATTTSTPTDTNFSGGGGLGGGTGTSSSGATTTDGTGTGF
jgi:hypothetical protein